MRFLFKTDYGMDLGLFRDSIQRNWYLALLIVLAVIGTLGKKQFEALGLAPVVVVGLSMGGYVALDLARRRGGVDRVVGEVLRGVDLAVGCHVGLAVRRGVDHRDGARGAEHGHRGGAEGL